MSDYRRRVQLQRAGKSALHEDEEHARQTIERLHGAFRRGETDARQERLLRDAMSLVRRAEKMTAEELRLRARRGWVR